MKSKRETITIKVVKVNDETIVKQRSQCRTTHKRLDC